MNHVQEQLNKVLKWRMICQIVTAGAFIVSAAGNALHAPRTFWGIAISQVAPVFLFVCFELVIHIPLDKERSAWFKAGRLVGTLSIAVVAAVNSYFHQRDAIFVHSGGDQLMAWTLPGAIDGLMIVCSVTLVELEYQRIKYRAYLAAGKVKAEQMAEPAPRRKEREPNGRERVMATLAKHPTITVRELAQRAGVSEGYASTLTKELRSEMVPADA